MVAKTLDRPVASTRQAANDDSVPFFLSFFFPFSGSGHS
jgi:hypothetical protein